MTSSSSIEKNDITVVEDPSQKREDSDRVSVLDFGGDTSLPPPPNLSPEEEKRLFRKIDLRLMPILSLMYLLSFLDRGALVLVLNGTEA